MEKIQDRPTIGRSPIDTQVDKRSLPKGQIPPTVAFATTGGI